ncbi:MAG: hypothetical protein HYX73_03265 [Acidobacteria bacterium]|nr:hypothetical protein [Acidobacteriota bacterium]
MSQQLVEAYSRLKALKGNLPSLVDEIYVIEYHEILAMLEELSGVDLKNFRVPASQIRPRLVSGNLLTGEQRFSNGKYVQHSFLMMRIDGVLNMFEILSSQPKTTIGFTPPTK